MYIEKEVKPGYNEYLNSDINDGQKTKMDIGLLWLKPEDEYSFYERDKEVAILLLHGEALLKYDGKEELITRPEPFSYAPYCLLMPRGTKAEVIAKKESEFFIQKTVNDRDFKVHLYTPEETHTWQRGVDELDGTMRRDVRTVFDYESRPDSNMVLGEVVNPGGKWSSYPPHHHPQPEVYFYYFSRPQGFGAGWTGHKVYTTRHHGLLIVADDTPHQQVMAPGYPCMYIWAIRHLDGNPWEKTRIDEEEHTWLLEDNPDYWRPAEVEK